MRNVRLDANLGTGFDSCTDVQVCGAMLDADLGTDLRRSVLGSMLGADLGTGIRSWFR
jgi:hypothetical protein